MHAIAVLLWTDDALPAGLVVESFRAVRECLSPAQVSGSPGHLTGVYARRAIELLVGVPMAYRTVARICRAARE